MAKKKDDGNQVSQAQADAAVFAIWQAAAANGHQKGMEKAAGPKRLGEAEAAVDRHVARQRAAKKPGW